MNGARAQNPYFGVWGGWAGDSMLDVSESGLLFIRPGVTRLKVEA